MTQRLLLFALLLITVFVVLTGVCVVKINKLNKIIEKKDVIMSTQQTNNKKSVEKIHMLTNQLNYTQQKLSMLNRIIYSNSYSFRTTLCFAYCRFSDLSIMKPSLTTLFKDFSHEIHIIIAHEKSFPFDSKSLNKSVRTIAHRYSSRG
jgi:hypothetical protein